MNADIERLSFDEEMLIGVMLGCIMRRLKDRGWSKEKAEQSAGKTIDKALAAARKLEPTAVREVASAIFSGAPPSIAQTMMISAYALTGVTIADDLFNAAIAETN